MYRWTVQLAFACTLLAPACGKASAAPATLCKEENAADPSGGMEMDRTAQVARASVDWLKENECLSPFKLIRFGSADVLITVTKRPGSDCHGCAAILSAFVFRRHPAGPALVARFANFGEAGTNGFPGRIDGTRIAGDDGFVIESGGTFQGYSSSRLDLYVFLGSKLVHLEPTLDLSASNGGAVVDDAKAISVDGTWTIPAEAPNNQVAIDYQVVAADRTTRSRALWEIEGSRLTLRSGRVPPEFGAASGG